MGSRITDETLEYVGILAQLELTEQEREQARSDMEKMLDYVDRMNELNTEGVEPMFHVIAAENVFRQDIVTNGDGSEDTLANAPQVRGQSFVVPKTVE